MLVQSFTVNMECCITILSLAKLIRIFKTSQYPVTIPIASNKSRLLSKNTKVGRSIRG